MFLPPRSNSRPKKSTSDVHSAVEYTGRGRRAQELWRMNGCLLGSAAFPPGLTNIPSHNISFTYNKLSGLETENPVVSICGRFALVLVCNTHKSRMKMFFHPGVALWECVQECERL